MEQPQCVCFLFVSPLILSVIPPKVLAGHSIRNMCQRTWRAWITSQLNLFAARRNTMQIWLHGVQNSNLLSRTIPGDLNGIQLQKGTWNNHNVHKTAQKPRSHMTVQESSSNPFEARKLCGSGCNQNQTGHDVQAVWVDQLLKGFRLLSQLAVGILAAPVTQSPPFLGCLLVESLVSFALALTHQHKPLLARMKQTAVRVLRTSCYSMIVA